VAGGGRPDFDEPIRVVFDERNRLLRARLYALTTSDTSTFAKAVLGVIPPAFRILAPLTMQRTAFEEYCRADTRPVMYGVLLDVEYESLYF